MPAPPVRAHAYTPRETRRTPCGGEGGGVLGDEEGPGGVHVQAVGEAALQGLVPQPDDVRIPCDDRVEHCRLAVLTRPGKLGGPEVF